MECRSCGATLQPGATNCPSCGAAVVVDTSDSSPYEANSEGIPYIPYTPLKEKATPASSSSPATPPAQEGSRSIDSLTGTSSQQAAASSGLQVQVPGAAQPDVAQQGGLVQPQAVQQIPQRRQGPSASVVALSIILALLILGGAGGLIYYTTGPYPAELHAQATAVVQNILTARAQANAQATANIATLTPQELYNRVTSEKPAINEPLVNSNHRIWISGDNPNFHCDFTGGTYHASVSPGFISPCLAPGIFVSNFAFQVQMSINKGDAGGLLFRTRISSIPSIDSYFFEADRLGDYRLFALQSNTNVRQLTAGTNSAFNTGPHPTNLLTVIAHGNNLYLYVNKQYIANVIDNTFNAGTVGVSALGSQTATDVVFSNAEVWIL